MPRACSPAATWSPPTDDSVAFRVVAADEHPDTLHTVRNRFLKEIAGLLGQVLLIARTLGVRQRGHIALDGSTLKANASKHSALSHGHIKQLEAHPDGINLPAAIARREDRLKARATANTIIDARAPARVERERPTTRPRWISVRPNQPNAARRLAAEPRFPRSRARRTRITSTSPTKNHAS